MAEFDGEARGPLASDATGASADIVTEARERYQICMEAEDRTEALDDLRFLKGDQWDAEAKQQRELDNRPCLTFNNIPAIIHQVTNDARQNKQSVQVAPVDDGADKKVAEVIEGLIRHIEYDSGADAAYDNALDGAARIGFGYFRLVTEYESPESFNQDIKIRRIRNPFTVYMDPNAQEADGSDAQYAFISSRMSRPEFERTYPKASATGEGVGTSTGDNGLWGSKEWVRIAEYYRIEHVPDELWMLPDGSTALASSPEGKTFAATGQQPRMQRATTRRTCMWYKITGSEVLEKAEIACDWIPVFPVYGDEIDEDGTVTRNGIIRHAKSPKQMENYWLTSATEEIAMRTKTPFIGAMGQFEGVENDWESANVRNFSYLEYNPIEVNGSFVPAPQRQAPADVPTGFIAMAGIARDTVKAVTGIYDASLGNRSNEVSGIAIAARQRQGDVGNFHFVDNLTRAIIRMAKCLIQMIPRIYDTQRVIRILGEDRKDVKHVAINTPGEKKDERGDAIATILNDLTVGKYDVTVSTGPAYNTLRQETVANMIEVGGKWPKLFELAGDKLVGAMDWPGAAEIAERLERALPPGIKGGDDDDAAMVQTPKGPIPAEQAGQMIGQLDQALEAAQAEIEKYESGQALEEIKNAGREAVARIQVEGRQDAEELKGMIQLLLARVNPMMAHTAAVIAADDPNHPAPPAPIAQAAAMPAPPAGEPAAPPVEASSPEPGGGETPPADGAAM
jgi:hypothetical protein